MDNLDVSDYEKPLIKEAVKLSVEQQRQKRNDDYLRRR